VYVGFWRGNLREREHFEDPDIDDWIYSDVSSGSGTERHGLDLSGSGWEQVVGTCKSGNEPSSSIKCREFLD
jgi:hypothetical protein